MVKSRLSVGNGGLARNLGQECSVTKEGVEIKGEMSYVSGFKIQTGGCSFIPINFDDPVGLPVGSVYGNEPHLRSYIFKGTSYNNGRPIL